MREPDVRDHAYGPHELQRLDLWFAESGGPAPLLIYIHGGGFMGGDKSRLTPAQMPGLLQSALDNGVSCAALNYRLSDVAPYPAQMHDAALAVQHLRHRADEWNIDPKRFAATGGSAGAGISLWLAFHKDMAMAEAGDPIARESTHLSFAIALNSQCTYDPREIIEIVPGNAYDHVALKKLHALPEGWNWAEDEVDERLDALLRDVSPVTHLTADAPPVLVMQYASSSVPGNIHHGNFGAHLKKRMDEVGVECVSRLDSDYEGLDTTFEAESLAFMKKHFGL